MNCSNVALASMLLLSKRIMKLIWIIAPILTMVSLTVNITLLVKDPDDKKIPKKIQNSVLALVLVFLVPTIVNAFMLMLDDSVDISACWNVSVNPSNNSPTYVDPYPRGNKGKLFDAGDYETGTDGTIMACGNLEYCNKYITSLYNYSKKLNDAILNHNATVEYSNSGTPGSWSEAVRIAESGGKVKINCTRPSQWGVREITGERRNFYSSTTGGFKHYEGPMKKYTKQLTFSGSKSVKTAIKEGLIQPGDIIGTKAHTFSIYSVNRNTGSAIVFDGGHQFTNKCQKKKKCSTMFEYPASTNSRYKLYQIIRWVK